MDEKIIYSNLNYAEKEGKPVDIIKYRGYELGVWCDDYSQSFYSIIDDEEINFGSFNSEYRNDLEYVVDDKLDTIYRFDDFFGARLKYENTNDGENHRDAYLLFRLRLLHVWPDCKLSKDELIVEAEKILEENNIRRV